MPGMKAIELRPTSGDKFKSKRLLYLAPQAGRGELNVIAIRLKTIML
jgi:hypothetical protein